MESRDADELITEHNSVNECSYQQQNNIYERDIECNIQTCNKYKIYIDMVYKANYELLGTFTFIFIALATVNNVALNSILQKEPINQLIIALGFALGLSSGVHLSIGTTGGHLNPAISFTMALFKQIDWMQALLYIIFQTIGAFLAALAVFCIYYDSIVAIGYTEQTAGLFGTLKASQTSIGLGLFEQIVGTILLMFGILVVCKENPHKPNTLLIGLILGTLALCLGNNGFAFNMARDLGPRMMSSMFWGKDVFIYQDNWWWVPIVGSFIGAPIGYIFFKYFEILTK